MIDKIIKNSLEFKLIKAYAGGTLYVKNKIQKALWDSELTGQISDGMWENSNPHDHWQVWSRANCQVGGQGTKNIPAWGVKRNYNFLNSMLLNVIGDRMIGMGRLIKKYPIIGTKRELSRAALSFAESVWKADNITKLKDLRHDFTKKYAKQLTKATGATVGDLVLVVNDNSLYSGSDLRKDLKGIKESVQTSLDDSFEPKTEEESEREEIAKDEKEAQMLEKGLHRRYVKQFKDHFKIKNMKNPIWEEYVTIVGGGSKKFHYFAVMITDDRQFAVGNMTGRIGTQNPVMHPLEIVRSKLDALNIAKKKLKGKLRKYEQAVIEAGQKILIQKYSFLKN